MSQKSWKTRVRYRVVCYDFLWTEMPHLEKQDLTYPDLLDFIANMDRLFVADDESTDIISNPELPVYYSVEVYHVS